MVILVELDVLTHGEQIEKTAAQGSAVEEQVFRRACFLNKAKSLLGDQSRYLSGCQVCLSSFGVALSERGRSHVLIGP